MKSGSSKFFKKPVFIVFLLLLALFLILLFSGYLSMIHYSKPISQTKAMDICPFLLITEEERDLLNRIRQDEDIASYITKDTPPDGALMDDYESKEIEGAILARYDSILTLNGIPAAITTSMITDYGSITLGYSTEDNMCYLTLSSTGAVSKSCAEYDGTRAAYIVENKDNEVFTKLTKTPKIIYDLFLR